MQWIQPLGVLLDNTKRTRSQGPRIHKGFGPFLFSPINPNKKKELERRKKVRTMSVLFSELLMPGWAECGEKIGLGDVTGTYDSAIAFTLPCHSADPELFFSEDEIKVADAKSLCGECPVRKQCLEGALSRQEPVGVWGGELFEDGKVIARKRKAGRPRMDQVATAVVLESVSTIEVESEREESAA
jgi:WhiB family transcriptional regulator, redox-sensing transcriptional regulator